MGEREAAVRSGYTSVRGHEQGLGRAWRVRVSGGVVGLDTESKVEGKCLWISMAVRTDE